MNYQWNEAKIKDIAKIGDGAHASIKRIENGVMYLSSKNFGIDRINFEQSEYISLADYQKHFKENSKAVTKPQENDVLLGIIGTLGAPYLVKQNDFFGLSSSVSIIRSNVEVIDPKYLYYWFKSPIFQQSVNQTKSGVAQSFLSLGMIGSLPCYYPNSLPIQKKIAAILSAYDDLIENNLKQIRLLEEMAQITYQEWFVRLKFPNHENTHIDETTGLPISWEYKKLGEHVELIKDSVLPENLDNIRYIGLEHIPRKSIVLSEYGNSDNVNSLKLIIQKGDILFGKIRPYFHKVGVALFDCISSTDIIVMRAIEKQLHGIILQNVFSENFVKAAVQSSNGTKMPRASWDVLKNYQIIIPEKTVLTQFAEMSDNIISTISNLANQNQRLKEARDILLPRLMTGKITVDDL